MSNSVKLIHRMVIAELFCAERKTSDIIRDIGWLCCKDSLTYCGEFIKQYKIIFTSIYCIHACSFSINIVFTCLFCVTLLVATIAKASEFIAQLFQNWYIHCCGIYISDSYSVFYLLACIMQFIVRFHWLLRKICSNI